MICQKCKKLIKTVYVICPNCQRIFHRSTTCVEGRSVQLTEYDSNNRYRYDNHSIRTCIKCGQLTGIYGKPVHMRFCPFCGAFIYAVCRWDEHGKYCSYSYDDDTEGMVYRVIRIDQLPVRF